MPLVSVTLVTAQVEYFSGTGRVSLPKHFEGESIFVGLSFYYGRGYTSENRYISRYWFLEENIWEKIRARSL